MTTFSVWAPEAERVGLLIEGQPHPLGTPMEPGPGGWFEAEIGGAGPGTRYELVVDGSEPLPDPRSPWQPDGIEAPSALVDHAAFAWTDRAWRGAPASWVAAGCVYELHVGTFTPEGTFTAAIDRLGHLVELGVRAVEIMPVAEFSGSRGWGYDGVFLYAPHHAYGGPEGLKALVDACHGAGLAVILDVVYNHLGPAGNVLERFGPYFTSRYATPWGKAVNLDGAWSDGVRRFFIDNALMWLRDYHVDGLRIDAVHAIVDTSAIHFLEQMAREVEDLSGRVGRELLLIAESDLNDPRVVRPRELGGYGMDSVWNEDFHHALHSVLTGERDGYYRDFGTIGAIARCLQRGAVYDGRYSAYRKRRHGRPVEGLSGRRFVGFLQNHDQIGNRALGERTSALMNLRRLKIGAALVLTAPFVPMLFMGEEWGASTPFLYFTDHQDPALGAAVREGRRKEFAAFGWDPEAIPDPQDAETFERSKLSWAELGEASHAEMLEWHRLLLGLRRCLPDLTDARLERVQVSCSEETRSLRVRRGAVEILVNLAPVAAALDVEEGATLELASEREASLEGEQLRLPPESVAVLRLPGGPVSGGVPAC
jgi:maltooligosyltrehalose trehalohydrolase